MSIGAIRFRVDAAGLCILQVQETKEVDNYGHSYPKYKTEWRDAMAEDLLEVAKYTRAVDSLDTELASVRQLAEAVRGELSAYSTRQQGSTHSEKYQQPYPFPGY